MAKKTAIGIDLGTTYSLWTNLQSLFCFTVNLFFWKTTCRCLERTSFRVMISLKSQVASVCGRTTAWKLLPTTRATEPLLPMWPSLTLSDSSVMPPRTRWHVIPRTRLLDDGKSHLLCILLGYVDHFSLFFFTERLAWTFPFFFSHLCCQIICQRSRGF